MGFKDFLDAQRKRLSAQPETDVQREAATRQAQFLGSLAENLTLISPEKGLAVRTPYTQEIGPTGEDVFHPRWPLVPVGTPESSVVVPPYEKKGLVEQAPLAVQIAGGLLIPGPGEIVRGSKWAREAISAIPPTRVKGMSKLAKELFGEVEARGPAEVKVFSTGKIAGAPRDPFTGKEIRVPKDKIRKLLNAGHLEKRAGGMFLAPTDAARREVFKPILDHVDRLVSEGEGGKFWYELSGQEILRLTDGDREASLKLAGLLAIYSKRASVSSNATFALRAFYAHQARATKSEFLDLLGKATLGQFPDSDAAAAAFLYDTKLWDGAKTSSFFVNLLRDIEPELHDALKRHTTVDRWVVRGLGFPTDAPADQQYAVAEAIIQTIADRRGWEPHQVQAAMWVSTKARWDAVRREVTDEAIKKRILMRTYGPKANEIVQINAQVGTPEYAKKEAAYLRLWGKRAWGKEVDFGSVADASKSFGDVLTTRTGYITLETLPSKESGVLPGMHSAPKVVKESFHMDVVKAAMRTDEHGNYYDPGVRGLGLLTDYEEFGPGYYVGSGGPESNPVSVIHPVVPLSTKGLSEGAHLKEVLPDARRRFDLYARARGWGFYQEGSTWNVVFDAPGRRGKTPGNAFVVDLGGPGDSRDLEDVALALHQEASALHARLSASGSPPSWSPNDVLGLAYIPNESGIHVLGLDFMDIGKDRQSLQSIGEEASKRLKSSRKVDVGYSAKEYTSNYISQSPDVLHDTTGKRFKEMALQDGMTPREADEAWKWAQYYRNAYDSVAREYAARYPQASSVGEDWSTIFGPPRIPERVAAL